MLGIYKHAKDSIIKNVEAAQKKGLKEIAITDHGYKHLFFGMRINQYKDVRGIIDEINYKNKQKGNDFKIFLGVESNIINRNGQIDINEEILKYIDLICIGYHKGAIANINLKKNYSEAVINAILKYNITILNHPIECGKPDIIEIGKAAASRNTVLELNRKHKNLSVEEVRKLKQMGVKFSLGSDSHSSENVGCFGEAYNIALEAGLTNDDILNADGQLHSRMKLLRFKE